jgi:hypothetical protein
MTDKNEPDNSNKIIVGSEVIVTDKMFSFCGIVRSVELPKILVENKFKKVIPCSAEIVKLLS